MPAKSDNGLPVEVRKSADGERYEFGVEYSGAFVPFASSRVEHVEAAVQDAKSESDD